MGMSSAISRRKRNTSAAENTNEFSSSRSPGCCHVLNSASKDWKPGLEKMMSSAWDGWKDWNSWEKQPSKSNGAVKLWNRIWKRNSGESNEAHTDCSCTSVHDVYMNVQWKENGAVYTCTCTLEEPKNRTRKVICMHITCTMYHEVLSISPHPVILPTSNSMNERYESGLRPPPSAYCVATMSVVFFPTYIHIQCSCYCPINGIRTQRKHIAAPQSIRHVYMNNHAGTYGGCIQIPGIHPPCDFRRIEGGLIDSTLWYMYM